MGELSLEDTLAFRLLLADVDPQRFDRAIARWHARLVLEARGMTADEAVLALTATNALGGLRTREVGAQALSDLVETAGLDGVVHSLRER
jgi:hypothetical protein